MHVVAVATEASRWRWQIWSEGRVLEESGERYPTMAEALADGSRRAVSLEHAEPAPSVSRKPPRERRAS